MSDPGDDTDVGSGCTSGHPARPPIVQNFVLELLSEIFLLCLPDDLMAKMRSNEAPLNVSHVCRTWRNAALLTRSLWARVHVVCSDENATFDVVAPALRTWLSRSAKLDLSVRIECPIITATFPSNNRRFVSWGSVQVVFFELARFSFRLKSLSARLPGTFSEDVLNLIKGGFQSLRYLDVSFDTSLVYSQLSGLVTFSPFFSRLSELRLGAEPGHNVRIFLDDFPLCSGLRKLALNLPVTAPLFVLIMKNCPLIEEVSLDHDSILYNGPFTQGTFKRLVLKSVRVLTLCVKDSRFTGEVLKSIQMPALLDFTLSFGSINNTLALSTLPHAETQLVSFLTCSNPPLKSLILKGLRVQDSTLLECVELLPDLQHLQTYMTEPVARALTLPANMAQTQGAIAAMKCPALEELTVMLPPLDYQDALILWGAMEDMIRSRWPYTRSRKIPRVGKGAAVVAASRSIGQIPKTLRRVNLPSVEVKHHPLYKGIKDCIKQGFVLGGEKMEP